MRRHNEDPRLVTYTQTDPPNPPFHLVLLLAFARVPDQQVEGPLREEELVANPVDLLAAEIPSAKSDVEVQIWVSN
jgi:hypothetical protein